MRYELENVIRAQAGISSGGQATSFHAVLLILWEILLGLVRHLVMLPLIFKQLAIKVFGVILVCEYFRPVMYIRRNDVIKHLFRSR